jgi:hypothetical protein
MPLDNNRGADNAAYNSYLLSCHRLTEGGLYTRALELALDWNSMTAAKV